MTTREVARRAGVSHSTVTYHFGDRAGLLTAIAVEGYAMLADVLELAHESNSEILGSRGCLRALRSIEPCPFRGHVPTRAVQDERP